MVNLELKVRGIDHEAARQTLKSMGATDQGASRDVDTYFGVRSGRLKLRRTGGSTAGTLIFYDRQDEPASRPSEYQLACVDDAEGVGSLLAAALGTIVHVRKTRQLFLFGVTRIHLDEVDGLGRFLELETVLGEVPGADARAEHKFVKQTLALDQAEPVASSYGDLVLASAR